MDSAQRETRRELNLNERLALKVGQGRGILLSREEAKELYSRLQSLLAHARDCREDAGRESAGTEGQWISVEERLPEWGEYVLVFVTDDRVPAQDLRSQMASGLSESIWTLEDIITMADSYMPKQAKRGPCKKGNAA